MRKSRLSLVAATPLSQPDPDDVLVELVDKIIALYDAVDVASEKLDIEESLGLTACMEEQNRYMDIVARTPAQSLRGLVAKARVVDRMVPPRMIANPTRSSAFAS